jgi:hypothetical protein
MCFDSKKIPMRQTILSLALTALGLILSSPSQAGEYELGQGWQSGHYHLSGYANIEVINRFGIPSRLDLDDLSLFAAGRINQWINPFTEVELSKQTLIRQGGGATDGDFIVERFYNDLLFSEYDTLRIGKILTPLGDWNLVHAAPLIPIITRPYTTARGFAAYVSGVNWMHDPENGVSPDLQLYVQPDNEWFKRPVNQTIRNFQNVIGGHLNMPLGLVDKIGLSFQRGELMETEEKYILFGANGNKSFGKLKLESETIISHFSGTVAPGTTRYHDNETGVFVLADYSITPKLHGIVEAERYQDHTVNIPSRNTLAAVAYRPNAAMVWKLEYIHQAGAAASIAPITTGFKAAFALFF